MDMKNLKEKSKKSYNLLLIAIFCLAFFLRIIFLQDNTLTFGYDQARDSIIVRQILAGDFKIQGPPSSQPGLFHGVFYYYLLAPAYLIGNGSPIVTAYYLAFLNSLTVIIVFLIAKKATEDTKLALLSSFLFAISFESTQYATWLSNPTIAVWTVPLMYLGLWIWINQKNNYKTLTGPILAAIGLGLSVQAEIFLIYHIVSLLIWILIYKKEITKKSLIIFGSVFTLVISTLILCEFKFGFNSLNAIRSLASASGNLAYAKSVGDYLILYLNQIGRIFAFNTYPGNIGYGGIAVIALGIYSIINYKRSLASSVGKRNIYPAFLAVWLFAHLSVVTVGGTSTPFLMVGIGPAVSLMLAFYIYKLFNKSIIFGMLVLLIILYGNLSYIFSQNKFGSTLFSIQKDMLLSKQIAAIDYTYKLADGKPFSVNSLTSPLWINIVWTYLYKWYGMNTYGYVPSWHGKDQIGQLDSLERVENPLDISFLILEPMAGIPTRYLEETIGEEDVDTVKIEEKSFGELVIQKRYKIR
ncbi:MAG: hypothetical protein ACD_26C00034G0086 [uncultured bacterium]|nr:MAG: hypothetical protein ACD_26C00034G0086 [uncultured bacterium]